MRELDGNRPVTHDSDIGVAAELDLRALEPGTAPVHQSPLIVVGDPGGRAMLGELLNLHTPFACAVEDQMLVTMAGSTQDSAVRLARQGHAVDYWYAGLARSYRGIQANRIAGAGKERWACTVDVERLPLALLDRLFPDAHFVNVVPLRQRRRIAQRGVRSAARALPRERYHEVAEADLISRTEECLLRLLVALALPAGWGSQGF